MKRLGLLLVAAMTLAAAGTAGADTFVVAPSPTDAAPQTAAAPVGPRIPNLRSTPTAPEQQVSLSTLRDFWGAAGAAYGIPWQVLAAINKIESNFGRNQGPSSAGAIGWMQFMPSTWLRWGYDADGNGVADPTSPADAIYSAARYLAGAGGQYDLRRAIFAYNHAGWYVNDVLSLAALYGQGGADTVFTLDRLQADVDASSRQVAEVNKRLIDALRQAKELARTEDRFSREAVAAPLLSSQLKAAKLSVLVGVRRDTADRRVAALRSELAIARDALTAARDRASGASFQSAAAQLLSAPTYAGSYVFPVGGGPEEVSVSSTHHDYPAADIAAPEGAPVYSLADALVVKAWGDPVGSCGIGATITTADDQTWTYCHLSYLDTGVYPGATLAAGAPIGLVGQTGDATGPHLHLQLDPTTRYPQDEPWFRAFANTAFRWQGDSAQRDVASAFVSSRPALFVVLGEPEVPFAQFSGAVEFSQSSSAVTFSANSDTVPFSQNVAYFTH